MLTYHLPDDVESIRAFIDARVAWARALLEPARPSHVDHEECWCEPVVYPLPDGSLHLEHREWLP